jgi:hypothetical protein
MQGNDAQNLEFSSLTETRWNSNNLDEANRAQSNETGLLLSEGLGYGSMTGNNLIGQRYGLQPETAQVNGWFTINERKNTFSFSNDLVGRLIILEYISDGLAYDLDTKVPKMAEEALYAYMSHAVVSTKAGQPEYVVNRLSREKVAKLRNAKIRLSNIKLEEISQVMRGKSKWIKS